MKAVPTWRTALDRVARVVDLGIPPDALSAEALRRLRIVSIATLSMFALGPPTVLVYWALGVHSVVVAIVSSIVLASANLWLLRRTRHPALCGNIANAILAGLILYTICVAGGFRTTTFAWIYLLPLSASVVVGLRGAAVWAAISVGLTFAAWAAPGFGVELKSQVPEALRDAQSLWNHVAIMLGISLIGSSFVIAQRRTEHELAKANEDLFRETASVQLLQHTAISANEATSFEEAMRSAVDRICETMGWPAGQIHNVVDGRLVGIGGRHAPSAIRSDHIEEARSHRSLMLPQRALDTMDPVVLHDFADEAAFPQATLARKIGLRSAIAIPVIASGEVRAVLEFGCTSPVPPDENVLEVLHLMGVQLGRVAERTELQERVRRSQKMEAVGQLAAGLAHEINNPMSYVRSNLHCLREEWEGLREKALHDSGSEGLGDAFDECFELIADSLEGVDRTIAIVRDVKELSHTGASSDIGWEPADLGDLLEGALRVATAHAASGVSFERSYGAVAPVRCAANQLGQVFVNLIVNAIQAIDGEGTVRVIARQDGDWAVARVEDDGPGMSSETRERLFDPFFTTKPVGEGTGLGLYLSYEIVRNHGGEIRVESDPRTGTTFEVRLPIAKEA